MQVPPLAPHPFNLHHLCNFAEEIENLGGQLEKEEKKLRELEADHNKSLGEAKKAEEMVKDMKKKQTNDRKQIKALEEQLQAKDDLVRFQEKLLDTVLVALLVFKIHQEIILKIRVYLMSS